MRAAGSPSGLQKLMRAAGQPVPRIGTIWMWESRGGAIPGWWTGAIVYALALKGVHPMHLLVDVPAAALHASAARGDNPGEELLRQADAAAAEVAALVDELADEISQPDTNDTDEVAP